MIVKCSCCHTKSSEILNFSNYDAPQNVCLKCVTESIKEASPDAYGDVQENYYLILNALKLDERLGDKVAAIVHKKSEQKDLEKKSLLTSNRDIIKRFYDSKEEELAAECEGIVSANTMYKILNENVIGQKNAKLALAEMIDRRSLTMVDGNVKKLSTLLIGPTGCGKTKLVETIRETLNIPMATVDCSQLSVEGYVGASANSACLGQLIRICKGDVDAAEYGIVYLDEIDKLLISDKDLKKEFQSELLKMIEGADIEVEYPRGAFVTINTRNILFVASGAFTDLRKSIAIKGSKKQLGLSAASNVTPIKKEPKLRDLTRADLISVGVRDEFLGRFQLIENLDPINKKMLKSIFKDVDNSMFHEYQTIIKHKNIDYVLDDLEIDSIVEEAIKIGLGARSLRTIMESRIRSHSYKNLISAAA